MGYATDDGEQEDGVKCYAVAIPDVPVPMAISVSGPAFRMSEDVGERAIPLLVSEAKAISQELLSVLE
jgi:IclR family acetate operon transcriptional repressor